MRGMPEERFSQRHGYGREEEITVREDAPREVLEGLLCIFDEIGFRSESLRGVVCRVVKRQPDLNNYSYSDVWQEVQDLVFECKWFRVYDIVEAVHEALASDPELVSKFESAVNQYFSEEGVGWQLQDGEIRTRGSEAFEAAVRLATEEFEAASRPTASREIHEALQDLSRRPEPDLTGAVHHAMNALECVARDVCGDAKATLGEIVKRHPGLIPRPLDTAVEKAWGYASQMGRHIQEGREPDREEVELVVGLAATVATYLSRKNRSGQ